MKNLSARNPLGIIALFISLIYGTSALLVGTSVDKLTAGSQDKLVIFVVLFPVAVLFAFLYLVTWHHKKLYGPGDFRSDEGFLSTNNPQAIGQKYIQESGPAIEGEAAEPTDDVAQLQTDSNKQIRGIGPDSSAETIDHNAGTVTSKDFSRYLFPPSMSYMLEGLVMQELQTEFKSPIRRDARVALPSGQMLESDGIIETKNGPIIVEVKKVSANGNASRRIREGLTNLRQTMNAAAEANLSITRGILVLITEEEMSQGLKRRYQDSAAQSNDPIEIRFYQMGNLLDKFGFREDQRQSFHR